MPIKLINGYIPLKERYRMYVINQHNIEPQTLFLRFEVGDYIDTKSVPISNSDFEMYGKFRVVNSNTSKWTGARSSTAPYYGYGIRTTNKWFMFMGGILLSTADPDTNLHIFNIKSNDGFYIDGNKIYNGATAGITDSNVAKNYFINQTDQVNSALIDVAYLKISEGGVLKKNLIAQNNGAFYDVVNSIWYYNRESTTNQYPLSLVYYD